MDTEAPVIMSDAEYADYLRRAEEGEEPSESGSDEQLSIHNEVKTTLSAPPPYRY